MTGRSGDTLSRNEDEPRLVRLLEEGSALQGRLERFQADVREGKRSWYRQADNDAARALLLVLRRERLQVPSIRPQTKGDLGPY